MHGWDDLTEREKEVAARVAVGMTNREVAQDLFLATATVKQHLSRAMWKLGATNRTQVAVIALHVNSPTVQEIIARLYPDTA